MYKGRNEFPNIIIFVYDLLQCMNNNVLYKINMIKQKTGRELWFMRAAKRVGNISITKTTLLEELVSGTDRKSTPSHTMPQLPKIWTLLQPLLLQQKEGTTSTLLTYTTETRAH